MVNLFVMNLLFFLLGLSMNVAPNQEKIYIRVNQLGYLPGESKIALVFSHKSIREKFLLVPEDGNSPVTSLKPTRLTMKGWGTFEYYYEIDFSHIEATGQYILKGRKSETTSQRFAIAADAYMDQPENLLVFMRQQRCGYNPFLDMVCHQHDGRTMFGPMPDSTYLDVSGGWHDAGDQLKYLITGSYATAHMLLAFDLYPDRFADQVNALGQPYPNDIPDVLDEAKWGLEWIFKLHPEPAQLFHQIADDRDHLG